MAETFEQPKGFKKKLENFWYHYKPIVIIIAFVLFSVTFLTVDYIKKQDPDMVLCYVGQTYGDKTQFIRIEEEMKEIIGDVNGDGKTRLNYRLIVLKKDLSSYDVDKEQQFNYSFLDKDVRLYVIEEVCFEQRKDFFEPLEGVLPDKFLSGGLTNNAGQVCAVPLAGNKIAEKMDFARPEMYVGIKRIMDTEKHEKFVYAQHEKAKEAIRYIVEGSM